jgi:uncharacterized protein YjbI with pentapeptide repeats
LEQANLVRASLDRASLDRAILQDILWDAHTDWRNVRGLESATHVPHRLKQQLGLN